MKLLLPLIAFAASACAVSTHRTRPASIGAASRSSAMLAVLDAPGPIEVETVVSMDWAVERSGLINLDHPKAREAKLEDGDEAIQVYFHVLRHPSLGTFIIDTGVERALRDDPDHAAISGIVASAMHREKMGFKKPLGDWVDGEKDRLRGVFLTHLHIDHISGMPDVPKGTPIYTGPGETAMRQFLAFFIEPVIDRLLAGQVPISEWRYERDPDGRFEGVIDVFGDGSLWALWVPGHTPGSTAYVARTPSGPILFTGDACHTAWGWEHEVEPGGFSNDIPASAESLKRLRALAAEHPKMAVRLGHQPSGGGSGTAESAPVSPVTLRFPSPPGSTSVSWPAPAPSMRP
jgi:glyoxylase-like metal-dependent hydrolase (beta-lactamase superfamily II)